MVARPIMPTVHFGSLLLVIRNLIFMMLPG